MKERARRWWRHCGRSITWWCFRNRTSRSCSRSCDRTCTPREQTIPRIRCRSVPRLNDWGFVWRLWAIRRIIRRERCWKACARRRMGEPRLLVVRLGSLGDIVHTFPAVAGLRETFPAAQIIWLTHPRWELLIRSSGLASEVWATETRSLASIRGIVRRIRAARFTAAIDYQGLWKSAGLPLVAGVGRRIGFSSETIREFGVPILYTDRVRCMTSHIADQNGELSLRAGARSGVGSFVLQIPAEAANSVQAYLREEGLEQYIVLSPGGGWRSKCWPAQRFGALAQKIHDALGLRCVVNYGPGEEDLARDLCAAAGDARPLPYNGELGRLMAILK